MSLYRYKEHRPILLGSGHFIADNATLIGRVRLQDYVNIWFQSVIRGDVNEIVIGQGTNIQDLCMLHVTEEHALTIEEHVSVGHQVTLHGCHIEKECLIGMGAVILDGARIAKHCLVAAGSVVPPGKTYEEGSLIMGSPAKAIRKLKDKELMMVKNHYKSYLAYAAEFNDPTCVSVIKT